VSQRHTRIQVHGPALRSRRLAADLTLERLASDAGVPQARLQAIEAGASWMPVESPVARGLIEALDCDFFDLFDVMERFANGD
jgi:transcriptional regulator with XRE-family HTH domain